MPRVSVLVPIYNMEKYLRQCLSSLAAQTMTDVEFLCLDDGSTDSSPQIIEEFVARDARFRHIRKENSGYGDSMNRGIKEARGEYIGITEADDFASSRQFELLYDLASRLRCDLVKCDYIAHTDKGDERVSVFEGIPRNELLSTDRLPGMIRLDPCIWAALYRREWLLQNNICFQPTPGAAYQDTSFVFKSLVAAERVAIHPDALPHYRIDNPTSSMNTVSKAKVMALCEEYAACEEYINRSMHLRERYICQLNYLRLRGYCWNYNRAPVPDTRSALVDRWHREFREARAKGELAREQFTQIEWRLANQVADDGPAFLRTYHDEIRDHWEPVPDSWLVTETPHALDAPDSPDAWEMLVSGGLESVDPHLMGRIAETSIEPVQSDDPWIGIVLDELSIWGRAGIQARLLLQNLMRAGYRVVYYADNPYKPTAEQMPQHLERRIVPDEAAARATFWRRETMAGLSVLICGARETARVPFDISCVRLAGARTILLSQAQHPSPAVTTGPGSSPMLTARGLAALAHVVIAQSRAEYAIWNRLGARVCYLPMPLMPIGGRVSREERAARETDFRMIPGASPTTVIDVLALRRALGEDTDEDSATTSMPDASVAPAKAQALSGNTAGQTTLPVQLSEDLIDAARISDVPHADRSGAAGQTSGQGGQTSERAAASGSSCSMDAARMASQHTSTAADASAASDGHVSSDVADADTTGASAPVVLPSATGQVPVVGADDDLYADDPSGLSRGYFDIVRASRRGRRRSAYARTVLWHGEFCAATAPQDALRIIAVLKQRMPDIRLVMIGRGQYGQRMFEMLTLSDRLGLERTVSFKGDVTDGRSLEDLYHRADVMLVTSVADDDPARIFEAQACGLPCVAYELAGFAPFEEEGCVVPVARGDVSSAAEALEFLLGDDGYRGEMAIRARRSSRRARESSRGVWREVLDHALHTPLEPLPEDIRTQDVGGDMHAVDYLLADARRDAMKAAALEREFASFRRDHEMVIGSLSFRIGRAITWLPRHLRAWFKKTFSGDATA